MATEQTDLLVIGAGAAGAALTWRLSTYGVKVVCLEQGDWVDPSTFPSLKPDYETQLFRGDFNLSPNIRQLPQDYPVTTAGKNPPFIMMYNAVGGSTIHWQGHFPRFRPSDFKVRTLDGVADDWPISYWDLEPYYELNDSMVGVSGLAGDPANPPRKARQTPPLPLGKMGKTLVNGFEKLGWHWWISDQAILSEPYKERNPCMLHGKCMFGCPMGAKSTTDRTYWPLAIANGAEVRPWSRVKEVTVNDKGEAKGALYFDKKGNLHEIHANVVVVCCNGVGTPRLLLNSKSKAFPNGLGNENGVVGKYFMVHPTIFTEGIFEQELDSHHGPMGTPFYSQEFYETNKQNDFVRGYTLIGERTFGPLFQSRNVAWGVEHHEKFSKLFPHIAGLTIIVDDLPEEHNKVELDPDKTDSNGIAAAKVTYSLSENSSRMLDHAEIRTKLVYDAAGAVDSQQSPRTNLAHLMGTARMGTDPKRSVINADHQVHGVANLYIVDGSSFTTGSGVNPTSTIMALALRAADRIWEKRK
jgi:choline dehydrogenase-like flavoprotein